MRGMEALTLPLKVLAYGAPVVALLAFVVAAAAALAMARHRAPGVTCWRLATNGMLFFSGKGFTAAAEPHRKRFLRAFLLFFLALLLGAVAAILLSTTAPT